VYTAQKRGQHPVNTVLDKFKETDGFKKIRVAGTLQKSV
jgi:hypothetical protein